MTEGHRWPGTLVVLTAHPDDVAPAWAEHAQGVTYADGCWFITQADRIWRFPVDLDLAHAADAPLRHRRRVGRTAALTLPW